MLSFEIDVDVETLVVYSADIKHICRKHEFFEMPDRPMFVLWWIEPGHIPSLEEARERLEHYRTHGPGAHAFGWADLEQTADWRERRCA